MMVFNQNVSPFKYGVILGIYVRFRGCIPFLSFHMNKTNEPGLDHGIILQVGWTLIEILIMAYETPHIPP